MVSTLASGATSTRSRGFVMAPARLLYDERISGEEVRAWAVLEDLQRDEDHVDATTQALAEVLHCSHDTVERRVARLEAAGWLAVARKRGLQRANRYVVLGSPRRKVAGSGSRTGARSVAASMDHADPRDPSVLLRSEEEKISCPNKECDHGWVWVEVEGRYGVGEAARRCPTCHPAPF